MFPEDRSDDHEVLAATSHSTVSRVCWKGVDAVVKRSLHAREDPLAKRRWHREVSILKAVTNAARTEDGSRIPDPECLSGAMADDRWRRDCLPQMLHHDEDRPSIYLRYEAGVGLHRCVDEAGYSWLSDDGSRALWRQMAGGLSFLHARGIAHDDVKPENIVWDDGARRGALVDFGAAHEVDGGAAFDMSGTPCYVPPEYLRRERSEKYDVWALGVTMCFALGHIPLPDGEWFLPGVFTDRGVCEEMEAWIGKIVGVGRGLGGGGDGVLVARMVEEEPGERIAAAELVSLLG